MAFDEQAALAAVLKQHPKLKFPPGARYAYSNLSYWLLGRVIEQVSGTDYASYMRQHLFEPLGISESELATAKTNVDAAHAGYENSLAQIRRAEGFVKQARDLLQKTTIYSPIDGTISALSSEVGERVAGTGQYGVTEVMRVADLDNMEVRVNVNDGLNDFAEVFTIGVTDLNEQVSATKLVQNIGFTEDGASVPLADIVVSDPDAGEQVTATLTLANTGAGSLTTSGSATYATGTGVWAITDTVAAVNAALAAVSFTPGADNDVDTTITTHIQDQDTAGPADGTITLNVTPANDAPAATNLTQTKAYNEGDAGVALDDIVVSEVDTDPAQTITATLTLADGASRDKAARLLEKAEQTCFITNSLKAGNHLDVELVGGE